MASKKTATKSAPDKSRKAEEFDELLKRARYEVATLLKHENAETLTGRELKTGLKEVQEQMKRMLAFKKAPL
jgi:hypothetical protein